MGCGGSCCSGKEEKMTTGEQDVVLQYQPPSRNYLVAMLSNMRDASARAQQAFIEYHNGKARIEGEVRGAGLEHGYSEELMQRMYHERSIKEMAWLVDEYTYWREKAMWHASCITAENLMLDALAPWDATAPAQDKLVDRAQERDDDVPAEEPVKTEPEWDWPLDADPVPDPNETLPPDRCPTCNSRKQGVRRKVPQEDRGKALSCTDAWHDPASVAEDYKAELSSEADGDAPAA
jgi:hypothetical protein